MKPALLRATLLLTILGPGLLAGCIGSKDEAPAEPIVPESTGVKPELRADKGAITGLLVDDRFRPIASGLLLLQQTGETVRSNGNGEFTFVDLPPGNYLIRTTVKDHESSPQEVAVKAGEYTEARVVARRVMSEGGHVITREFTVFIPCAADLVANGIVADCLLDLSGDSFRSGFVSNYTNTTNVTYLVTEMKANKVGNYVVQVREDDGSSGGGIRYAVSRIKGGDYVKMVNKFNETNTEHNEQNNNRPWDNDRPFRTILFFESDNKDDVTGASEVVPWDTIPDQRIDLPTGGGVTVGRNPVCCGAGAAFGIKARFIQSLFLGEPEVDITTYRTMS